MKFIEYNIPKNFVDVLDKNNKSKMTEVQEMVIPLLLKSKQVICTAPTGTGKTYSFVLPILTEIDIKNKSTQAIIMAPTRELSRQIYNVIKEFKSKEYDISAALVVGGESLDEQLDRLKKNPQIVIGTPDRINKAYGSIGNSYLNNFKHLVIDEADMCLDLNFLPLIKDLLNKVKEEEVLTSFFSATIPNQLQNFINKNISGKFEFVNVDSKNKSLKISHRSIKTNYDERKEILLQILNSEKINPFFSIIFCSTKNEVKEVHKFLEENLNQKVGIFSSDLLPRKRKTELKLINNLSYQYVVASDLLARGIDIPGASHIFSFSIPEIGLEYYTHRSGRVGRNNLDGISFLFYDEKEKYKIDKISNNRNIEFEEYKWNIGKQELIKIKRNKVKKNYTGTKLEIETAKVISKYKNGPKKPGYKTKMNAEIDSLKRRYKKIENRKK